MPTQEFLAGTVSGAASVVASQPFDTIRVRMQVMKGVQYSTTLRTLMSTVRGEGALSLFKGVAAPLWTVSFQNAVVFHAYGSIGRWLEPGMPLQPEHVNAHKA